MQGAQQFDGCFQWAGLCARSVDPFSKKDWYDVKAPSTFTVRNVGKTLVTRTQGTKVSAKNVPETLALAASSTYAKA